MLSSLLKLGVGHRTFHFTLLSAVKLLTEEGARACNGAAARDRPEQEGPGPTRDKGL